jgi:iron complex transport system ATP-binding protein
MTTSGITHLAQRRIATLSGGEWQRVLIARTLAQETGIILLDEPTSHLDVSHQIEVLSALHTLTRSGTTVIAVFHDLNLASHYCDRIIALHEGRVAASGTPAEVITTDFLCSIPKSFDNTSK